jgi:hypothetical protein
MESKNAISHLVVCLIFAWALQAQAADAESMESAPDVPEVLDTIEADTSKAILKRFKTDNPGAREHKLGIVSEAFQEDPANPALRLDRMWVGEKGTLLEIFGMERKGRPESAIISYSSLRLRDKGGFQRQPLGYEGVTELRDKRGGSALVVRPGDAFYLLLPPIDDLQPHSLIYLGWDGKASSYFDRIDPRFRERYDASAKAAMATDATPVQMKDFLVEFARRDPDNKAPKVFLALINKMRAQNTFEGYYHVYLLIKDPADARAAQKLMRTDEHRAMMENLAVATLADKSRLLDMDFRINPGQTTSGEGSCWMLCRYNFTAQRAVSGTVTVRARKTGTPIRLRLGTYRVTLSTELVLPRHGKQESNWLGNFDKQADDVRTGQVTVTLSPPDYVATVPVSFGQVDVAFFQRGSAGGYTAYWADGDGRATLGFQSMELLK